jgi:hypothetical protein
MVTKNEKVYFSVRYKEFQQRMLAGFSAILTEIFARFSSQSLESCRNSTLKWVTTVSFHILYLLTPISFDAKL